MEAYNRGENKRQSRAGEMGESTARYKLSVCDFPEELKKTLGLCPSVQATCV